MSDHDQSTTESNVPVKSLTGGQYYLAFCYIVAIGGGIFTFLHLFLSLVLMETHTVEYYPMVSFGTLAVSILLFAHDFHIKVIAQFQEQIVPLTTPNFVVEPTSIDELSDEEKGTYFRKIGEGEKARRAIGWHAFIAAIVPFGVIYQTAKYFWLRSDSQIDAIVYFGLGLVAATAWWLFKRYNVMLKILSK
jgi:hypothetical protein